MLFHDFADIMIFRFRFRFRLRTPSTGKHLTLEMTSTQVVETSVTNNSYFNSYPHLDDHTRQQNCWFVCFQFLYNTCKNKWQTYPYFLHPDCRFAVLAERLGPVMHHTPKIIRKIKGINRSRIHFPEVSLGAYKFKHSISEIKESLSLPYHSL